MINKVIIKSPAKINLFLDILNRRSDGYHNVNMIMQSVTLFDTVIIERSLDSKISVNLQKTRSLDADINLKNNTAYIAANNFFEFTGLNNPGIKITLSKNIPVSAGLAGGSSDAAGVLLGLNKIFSTNLSKADLAVIGKKIGADVPFCIFGGTMLATGTGTRLSSLRDIPFCYFVLCKPNLKVSTQEAYEASDNKLHTPKSLFPILKAIDHKNLKGISNSLFNSFEEVLQLNSVDKIKHIMRQSGATAACMSGSGPTVYGIFNNKSSVLQCQAHLKKTYRDVFICQPQNCGSKIILAE